MRFTTPVILGRRGGIRLIRVSDQPENWEQQMDRRDFVGGMSYGGILLAGLPSRYPTWKKPKFADNPFSLGVASGDPLPDGVVLWTRLAPNPLEGGGMPAEDVRVEWRIASDEAMNNVVQRGTTIAAPDLGHSVHVEVSRLDPHRWYWYQFTVGSDESPIGRTRTAPPADQAVDRLDFVFASCQKYEQGYYTALRHLADENVDLVVHLGDYIYEGEGLDDQVRKHIGGEIQTLSDYRNRYAQYKTDPELQAAHHAFPWIVTTDDHEVDNNYASAISENHDPVAAFLTRRANAYQAFYEHLPLRRASMPRGPNMRLYRSLNFGNLAGFFVLDTRQYRTDQPCDDTTGPRCTGVFDANATMMGPEQERWLFDSLAESRSRWNVIAQQVMIASTDGIPGPEERYSMDKWAAYDDARNRLTNYLHDRQIANPVVLTGDIHSNWVADLKTDFGDTTSPTVGTEFVGTSLSSSGDGRDTSPRIQRVLSENPFIKFFNGQRGYVRCRITPGLWKSDYRVVDYVTRRGAAISTRASFVVEDGKRGVEQASESAARR